LQPIIHEISRIQSHFKSFPFALAEAKNLAIEASLLSRHCGGIQDKISAGFSLQLGGAIDEIESFLINPNSDRSSFLAYSSHNIGAIAHVLTNFNSTAIFNPVRYRS